MSIEQLVDALRRDDFSAARELLDSGVNVNSGYFTKDFRPWETFLTTPVSAAISQRNLSQLKFLLSHGADANFQCQIDGKCVCPPLCQAAESSDLDILKTLIQHGANILQADPKDGSIALHKSMPINWTSGLYLIDSCDTECALRQLHSRNGRGQKLIDLIRRNNRDSTQKAKMYDVNVRITKLERLFLAAEIGDVQEMMRCMTQADIVDHADVNRRNHIGETALHCASRAGQLAAIKFLLQEQKANRMVANDRGSLPVHQAARWNREEVARSLLTTVDGKPDKLAARQLAARDGDGRTPADVCDQYGHSELAEYMKIFVAAMNCPPERAVLVQSWFDYGTAKSGTSHQSQTATRNLSQQQQRQLLLQQQSTPACRRRAQAASKSLVTNESRAVYLIKGAGVTQKHLLERLRISQQRISELEAANTYLSAKVARLSSKDVDNARLLNTQEKEIARLSALVAENGRTSTVGVQNALGSTLEAEDVHVSTEACELINNCTATNEQSVVAGGAVRVSTSHICECDRLRQQMESLREDVGDLGTVLADRLERIEAQINPQ